MGVVVMLIITFPLVFPYTQGLQLTHLSADTQGSQLVASPTKVRCHT